MSQVRDFLLQRQICNLLKQRELNLWERERLVFFVERSEQTKFVRDAPKVWLIFSNSYIFEFAIVGVRRPLKTSRFFLETGCFSYPSLYWNLRTWRKTSPFWENFSNITIVRNFVHFLTKKIVVRFFFSESLLFFNMTSIFVIFE